MKIYDLHFNSKKKVRISESFQGSTRKEHRNERLYIVGELVNPKNKDIPLLQNLFHIANENFYEKSSLSSEENLIKTLKKVNNFLGEQDYNGELNIIILSIKNNSLYFSKIGDIKIFLSNKNSIQDIGEDIKNKTKKFQNVINGKISKESKLIILTSEVHNFFKKENIIKEIEEKPLDDKVMEKISYLQEKKFSNISGIAFIIDFINPYNKKKKQIVSDTPEEFFSFKKMVKNNIIYIKNIINNIDFSSLRIGKRINNNLKKISIKKKNIYLPIFLIFILLFGSLIMKIESGIESSRDKKTLALIEEKILEGREEKDFNKMKEVFLELEKLKKNSSLDVEEFHTSVKHELLEISKTRNIESLEMVGKIQKINPTNITTLGENIFLSSNNSSTIVALNPATGKDIVYEIPVNQGVDFSGSSRGRTFFFSSPDTLILLENEIFSDTKITLPNDYEEFISLSSFLGRPYFLTMNGEIITYSEKYPSYWLEDKKNINSPISITIDGSIFVLSSENEIHRYYKGKKEDIIHIETFPSLKKAKKIYTNPNTPLIVFDPSEERLIIVDKEGNLLEQIIHKDIGKSKDITITDDGKKIYLLIGKEVYLLEL